MNDNKNEYRILSFLKENVGFASLLVTLIGVILTAVGNYFYYIMMYSYLVAWNIPGEFAFCVHSKQMIIIALVFALFIVHFIINRIMVNSIDEIYLYDKLNRCLKDKIDSRLSNDIKEVEQCVHDMKKSALKVDESIVDSEYSEKLKNAENRVDSIKSDIKEIKKQSNKISRTIYFYYVRCITVCSLISVICFGALLFFLYDSVYELAKTALSSCLPIFLAYIIYVTVFMFMRFPKDKKIDEINERFDKTLSEIENAHENKSLTKYLSDNNIISFLILLCTVIIALMIVLPWASRNSINNQSRFSIVNYEGTDYVLVYYDGTDSIMKRCIWDNDSIKIDKDNYRIIESDDQEYQVMDFNHVDITGFD